MRRWVIAGSLVAFTLLVLRRLPLIGLLAGCGVGPVLTVCTAQGLEVHSELEIDCATMAYNVRLAKDQLDSRGILPRAEFETAFQGVPIVVLDAQTFEAQGHDVDGTYGPLQGIRLSSNASALLHEMLHHLDYSANVFALVQGHPNWDARGWTAADDEFYRHSLSPRLHWRSK